MELNEQSILMEKDERILKAGSNDSLTVRFKLMSAEQQNLNNRVYPRGVLAKAVEDLKARIAKQKSSFASCGHKKDGGEVDDATAYLEDVMMEGNDVYATAKVMPTTKGRNVITLLKHGAAIGVSARGSGDMDGNKVKPGFILHGFDWVLSPGFGTYASKKNIIESVTVPEETVDPAVLAAKGYAAIKELDAANRVDEEVALRLKYNTARQAGFAGSEAEYRATFNRTPEGRATEIRYAQAVEAGYRGDLEAFKKSLKGK